MDRPVPVVDVFAGPGGLSEGFSALGRPEGKPRFAVRLSIEKDPIAHKTLELRAFFRQFPHGDASPAYYEHLRAHLSRDELFAARPREAAAARAEAWLAELGAVDIRDVRKRITEAVAGDDRWVLIGGPPCQAYSKAGRARTNYTRRNKYNSTYVPDEDPRQTLYKQYLQILADHRPPVFVMENVKGLLSATLNDRRVFDRILEDLQSPADAIRRDGCKPLSGTPGRYRVFSLAKASMFGDCNLADFVVRAERHGIPQARHRIILLGVRDDFTGPGPGTLPAPDPVPAGFVLDMMPKLRSGMSNGADSPAFWKMHLRGALEEKWFRDLRTEDKDVHELVNRTLEQLTAPRNGRGGEFLPCEPTIGFEEKWFVDERLGGVCNHTTRIHMPSDLHRYLFAACFARAHQRSPKLRDFPKDLLPEHENVNDALAGGYFADRFQVQLSARPSTTVTSHMAKDGHHFIHPDPSQCRSLTVREAARLQTFPDNYFFCGPRTAQYMQVGNAVPPLLALQIAEIVWNLVG